MIENSTISQSVMLTDRHTLTLDGVYDVISFDDNGILMKTSLGTLQIDGEELHILNFSSLSGNEPDSKSGGISIEGHINGIFYIDEAAGGERRGLFGRRKR